MWFWHSFLVSSEGINLLPLILQTVFGLLLRTKEVKSCGDTVAFQVESLFSAAMLQLMQTFSLFSSNSKGTLWKVVFQQGVPPCHCIQLKQVRLRIIRIKTYVVLILFFASSLQLSFKTFRGCYYRLCGPLRVGRWNKMQLVCRILHCVTNTWWQRSTMFTLRWGCLQLQVNLHVFMVVATKYSVNISLLACLFVFFRCFHWGE